MAVIVWLSACGDDSEPSSGGSGGLLPITYNEIDLTRPDAAVEAFVGAFERGDFITTALIFHPDTQQMMQNQLRDSNQSAWVNAEAWSELSSRLLLDANDDHVYETLRMFDLAMQSGVATGGLRVDLSEGTNSVLVVTSDDFTALVEVVLTATAEVVTFELAAVPSGRWRIRQVRHGGGDLGEFPFSGHGSVPSVPKPERTTQGWDTLLPAESPSQTIETIARLVTKGDHLSLYFLLTGSSQRRALESLDSYISKEHTLGPTVLDERLDETGFPFDLANYTKLSDPVIVGTESNRTATVEITTPTTALTATLAEDSSGRWRLEQLRASDGESSIVPFPIA